MKKNKRFYDNKERDQKWTEPEKGRKIDFADKYIKKGASSDKFDYKRPKRKGYSSEAETRNKTRLKRIIAVVCAIVLVAVGYIGMDVYITRHAEPALHLSSDKEETGVLSNIPVEFSAELSEGIGLDDSVMLSAVMNDTQKKGFNAVAFEAKRENGTVGYKSGLASVDAFAAISFASEKPQQSVKALLSNDILPVAVIHCYKDNVVPAQASGAAIMNGSKLYEDEDGNNYLNPNSDFAYNYIKDIITELNTYGVTVFVLDSCDLPDEISKKYNDGFETIAKRLYGDIDTNVKLLEAVDVNVMSGDTGNEIKALKKLNRHKVYFVNTDIKSAKVRKSLEKKKITTYIINNV
ncbi:MAG: hypothetical protein IJI47_03770 [Eubacterium sp.]|nr:hypothetical protein [Eubacterium sp.]